jgi:hypothetical protein
MSKSADNDSITVIESLSSDKFGNYIVQRAISSFPKHLGLLLARKVHHFLALQVGNVGMSRMHAKILQLFPELVTEVSDFSIEYAAPVDCATG